MISEQIIATTTRFRGFEKCCNGCNCKLCILEGQKGSFPQFHWQTCLEIYQTGWKPPTIEIEGETKPKPQSKWSTTDYDDATWHSKGLNAIFNVVDVNQFKLISSCSEAKATWAKLEVTNVDASRVKQPRRQILHLNLTILNWKMMKYLLIIMQKYMIFQFCLCLCWNILGT